MREACSIVNKHVHWAVCADTFQGCRKTNDSVSQKMQTQLPPRVPQHIKWQRFKSESSSFCIHKRDVEHQVTTKRRLPTPMSILVPRLFTSSYPYLVKMQILKKTDLRPICLVRNMSDALKGAVILTLQTNWQAVDSRHPWKAQGRVVSGTWTWPGRSEEAGCLVLFPKRNLELLFKNISH